MPNVVQRGPIEAANLEVPEVGLDLSRIAVGEDYCRAGSVEEVNCIGELHIAGRHHTAVERRTVEEHCIAEIEGIAAGYHTAVAHRTDPVEEYCIGNMVADHSHAPVRFLLKMIIRAYSLGIRDSWYEKRLLITSFRLLVLDIIQNPSHLLTHFRKERHLVSNCQYVIGKEITDAQGIPLYKKPTTTPSHK